MDSSGEEGGKGRTSNVGKKSLFLISEHSVVSFLIRSGESLKVFRQDGAELIC